MSENTTNQITLTAEQLVNIVGHAATQEQLDNVRRELDTKIERVAAELDAKIDKLDEKLNSRMDKLDAKIDQVSGELNAKIDRVGGELNVKIDRVDGKIDTLKNWMLGMGFTVLVSAVAATAFIVSRLPPQ